MVRPLLTHIPDWVQGGCSGPRLVLYVNTSRRALSIPTSLEGESGVATLFPLDFVRDGSSRMDGPTIEDTTSAWW